jgi:hypothetical protein
MSSLPRDSRKTSSSSPRTTYVLMRTAEASYHGNRRQVANLSPRQIVSPPHVTSFGWPIKMQNVRKENDVSNRSGGDLTAMWEINIIDWNNDKVGPTTSGKQQQVFEYRTHWAVAGGDVEALNCPPGHRGSHATRKTLHDARQCCSKQSFTRT